MADSIETDRERTLLVRWAEGDRTAGEALLESLLPLVYGLCRRILKRPADAEEAAQEAFARLCSQVRGGEGLEDVRKWITTVAMNLCFDRRRQAAREIPIDAMDEQGVTAETIEAADLETVRERLDEMPERYRVILHLHFVMGLKPREIAEMMELEDGTARVLLHRALAALRKRVKG